MWDTLYICFAWKRNLFVGKTTKSIFPWTHSAKIVLIGWPKIHQMPKNLTAQFVCPIPKVRTSIVRVCIQVDIKRDNEFFLLQLNSSFGPILRWRGSGGSFTSGAINWSSFSAVLQVQFRSSPTGQINVWQNGRNSYTPRLQTACSLYVVLTLEHSNMYLVLH